MEYLESEFKTQGTPLYSFVNDEKGLLCEVVVPRPLRKRIEGGAFIDAIQILPPTKGYRVMANISIKGKRETVRILANFARIILHSTIKILVTGGCIGLDQNRIYYPRAFTHARVGVEGGDLEPVDLPEIDLALLLDLVKFTGEDVLTGGRKKPRKRPRKRKRKGVLTRLLGVNLIPLWEMHQVVVLFTPMQFFTRIGFIPSGSSLHKNFSVKCVAGGLRNLAGPSMGDLNFLLPPAPVLRNFIDPMLLILSCSRIVWRTRTKRVLAIRSGHPRLSGESSEFTVLGKFVTYNN